MITQTFSSPMLAEGIGSVTSQFKKGGMIKKNSKKKKLSSKQLDIIETYAKGGGVEEAKYLKSDGVSQVFVSNKKEATPMWIMDAEYYISSNPKNNATAIAEKIDKSLPDRVGKNYIVKIVSKKDEKLAKRGEVGQRKLKSNKELYEKLRKAEQNWKKDNGKEYNKILKEIDENRNLYYQLLREAERNGAKDNLQEYNRLLSMQNQFAKGGKLGKIIKNTQPTPTLSPKQIRLANEIAKEVVKTGLDATIKYDRSSIDIEIIYGNKFSESLSKGLFRVFWSRTGDNNIQYLGVGVGHYDGYQIKRGWSNDININEVQHFVKKDKDYYDSRKSVYAKGGTTDPKPTAQDILKRLGYNIPEVEENEEEEPKIIRGWVDDEPYYYKKGGRFGDDTPKVYIADLSEYNNGRLVGKWFDLTDYSDGAELMADIQEMLDEQTKKDKYGDVHEEWAVHDYENFPREFYSEYMGEADFDKLIKLINDTEDSGLPFDVISQAMADLGKDEVSDVVEAYFGSVSPSMGNEWRDFAHEYIDSIGSIEDAVSNPEYYFDFDSFGREARWDFSEEEEKEMGYEDMSDEELGEELVEEMGGVKELGKQTLEMYFDYDKFGRDLEYDFTAIRGEDGDYYFFNSNYKKGGKLKSKPEPEDDGEYVLSDEEKQIIRGYVDDEPYYFADGGEVTADERKKSLKGYPKLKF